MIFFLNQHKKIDNEKEAAISMGTRFLLSKLIRGNVQIHFEWNELQYPNHAFIFKNENENQSYTINLANYLVNDIDLLFRSIAHELVHVKQMATGQLSRPFKDRPFICSWKANKSSKPVFIRNVEVNNYSDYQQYQNDYLALPWEKEAFEKMDNLYLDMYGYFYQKSINFTIIELFKYLFTKKDKAYFSELRKTYGIGFFKLKSIYKIICDK